MRQVQLYFNQAGEPLDTLTWAKAFEETEQRLIAQDTIDYVFISTVWTGINMNFSLDGPPLIFETMIFGGEHDHYQERYATRDEALEGHRIAVEMVKNANIR